MSSHGRGGLGRWLYGSTAEEVLRQAPRTPVLLVSATCEASWRNDRIRKILVPLDGSRWAEQALNKQAQRLAETFGAKLVLLEITSRPRPDRLGAPAVATSTTKRLSASAAAISPKSEIAFKPREQAKRRATAPHSARRSSSTST